MMITVRLDSPLPLAEQILAAIRQLIAAGDLAPGDELPTVRQLAADLGINLNTVARGYRALEEAGLVSSVRGRGTQVTASAETARGTLRQTRARVAARLRDGLADAKLAALDRDEVQRMLHGMLDDYWPPADSNRGGTPSGTPRAGPDRNETSQRSSPRS